MTRGTELQALIGPEDVDILLAIKRVRAAGLQDYEKTWQYLLVLAAEGFGVDAKEIPNSLCHNPSLVRKACYYALHEIHDVSGTTSGKLCGVTRQAVHSYIKEVRQWPDVFPFSRYKLTIASMIEEVTNLKRQKIG